jgi:hypothetical protein
MFLPFLVSVAETLFSARCHSRRRNRWSLTVVDYNIAYRRVRDTDFEIVRIRISMLIECRSVAEMWRRLIVCVKMLRVLLKGVQ